MDGTEDFLLCTDCRRAYPVGGTKRTESRAFCPYPDCGSQDALAWEWSAMRKANPGLPRVPQGGAQYG